MDGKGRAHEVYHHRGRHAAAGRGSGAGREKQRTAHSGRHAAQRGCVPHRGLSAPERCGLGGRYPAVLRLRCAVGRRRSAGGQHHTDAVRHTPDADAADAVVRDLSGGDTGAVRLGGVELSRRVRTGAAAHRPAPGGPAGAGGGYRRRRRDPAVPGAAADRLPDRAGHAQRRRHGERYAGRLRRGG